MRSTWPSRRERAFSSTNGGSRSRRRSSSSPWPAMQTSARLAVRRNSRRSLAFPFPRCRRHHARSHSRSKEQPMNAAPDPMRWKALAVVCAAFFMTILDVSIVTVALPSIGRSLHFTRDNLQWVVTAYAIAFGGFLLLGGRAADLLGRRRVFIFGVALFTIASLVCGLAQNEAMLIT